MKKDIYLSVQFSSVQSLSHIWLFVTPWTAAHQASLSSTISRSLLKLMSIKSVMPSSHLILCRPFLLLPSIFPSIRVFSNESVLPIRWLKYWSFSFSISPSKKYSGMTSFRIDWLPCCPMLSKGLSRIFSSTTFNYHFWDLCIFKKASMEQTCICQGDGWDKDGVGVWG